MGTKAEPASDGFQKLGLFTHGKPTLNHHLGIISFTFSKHRKSKSKFVHQKSSRKESPFFSGVHFQVRSMLHFGGTKGPNVFSVYVISSRSESPLGLQ